MPIIVRHKRTMKVVTKVVLASKSQWPFLALAGLVSVYILLAVLIPPGADTLWRLHIAQGLLDGEILYRDLIEVNPPLWFWGAIPAAKLGGYPALVAINLLVTLVGIAVFGALTRLTLDTKAHWGGMLGLAAGLLLVNVGEIGQREQAFLLASALWSALVAARIESKAIPIWLVMAATGLAAYGFALKHYFVLVPVALEALIIWHQKRTWRPFRPENLLLAGLAGAYALAVVYLTPDFLKRVLGLVQAAYYGFGPWNAVGPVERQLRLILQCSFAVVPMIALILSGNKSALVRSLMVALALTIVIMLLQQKGWRYHLIAANGLAIMITGLIWQSLGQVDATRVAKRFIPLSLTVLLWTAWGQPALSNIKTHGQPMEPVLADIVHREPRDHHIAILSTAPDNAYFPLARAKREHWSGHYSMWMMPGLLTPQTDPKKEALRLTEKARVLAEFTSDLTCTPPDLIVGEVGYFRNPAPTLFDAMAFLREDKSFATWLDAHYAREKDIAIYPIWRLKGLKPVPLNCSKHF